MAGRDEDGVHVRVVQQLAARHWTRKRSQNGRRLRAESPPAEHRPRRATSRRPARAGRRTAVAKFPAPMKPTPSSAPGSRGRGMPALNALRSIRGGRDWRGRSRGRSARHQRRLGPGLDHRVGVAGLLDRVAVGRQQADVEPA